MSDLELPPPGSTVLVIVAHGDDPTLFCGGTLRLLAENGVDVTVLRVTDDRYDSHGLGVGETIERNRAEFVAAMNLLGVSETIDLGWETDHLGDASEVLLRERFIYHVRRLKPYAVMSYDPYGAFEEDNQDHIKVAAAVDETYWTAQFDKHHPEHGDEGIEPHGVYERWYFARSLVRVTRAIDISATIGTKVEAVVAHDTMMRNLVNQLRLQARTGGHVVPELEHIAAGGDLRPLLERLVRSGAQTTGARHGLPYAEEFRIVRFGGLEAAFGLR